MSPAPKKKKSTKKQVGKAAGKMAMNAGQRKILLAVGAAIAYLLYRHMHTGSTAAAVTPVTGNSSGSIQPYTPQSPIVVPAGESIYDPNSQGLLTAPDASGTSTPPLTAPATGANPASTLMAPITTRRTTARPAKRAPSGRGRVIPKTPMAGQAKTVKKVTTTNRHPVGRKRTRRG